MMAKNWKRIIKEYDRWLSGGRKTKPDLEGANLEGANLREADLRWANLRGANLGRANLREADLGRADLRWANLRGANLRGANLREANLGRANLEGADLRGANLPSPSIVLLASWHSLSDTTILALMRLDCSCLPDGQKKFDEWVLTGKCPFDETRTQRAALFVENVKLWSPGPPPTLWKAMKMVLDEKCPGWDEEVIQ
jgi:hypothetical protein